MAAFCLVIGLSFALRTGNAVAQTAPTLTISSPTDGTVIKPGQTLAVEVINSGLSPESKEIIVASDPIGLSEGQMASSSNQFLLSVPRNILPGSYALKAVARSQNTITESLTVSLTVIPTTTFDSLVSNFRTLIFNDQGETQALLIEGMSHGHSTVIPNQFISFSSADPSVATIDAKGLVTPISKGKTQITITYGALTTVTNVIVGGSFQVQGTSTGQTPSPTK